PGPEGRCCAALTCGPREEGWDSDADGCADTCRCASGPAMTPRSDEPSCPCPAMAECPPGSVAVDSDADGCADRCECDDGSTPGPAGCG
ncbi:MAG TPA: hypothetical protein PK095_04400, partial [Myxococcota bacterium]|nr:hypothetical protein [Myxococcota bacterium]